MQNTESADINDIILIAYNITQCNKFTLVKINQDYYYFIQVNRSSCCSITVKVVKL